MKEKRRKRKGRQEGGKERNGVGETTKPSLSTHGHQTSKC